MSEAPLTYDTVVIGGGPAGLACAIHCKQLMPEKSVCIIEKGANIGSHILSGAVLEPHTLHQLFPDWKQRHAPIDTAVKTEQFSFLTKDQSHTIPHWLLPKELHNRGNCIISLSQLCRWLGEQAESLNVDIFTSTTASSLIFEKNTVVGIQTGAMGLDKEGSRKDNYLAGINIMSQHLIIAEGARGFLAEKIIRHYQLRSNRTQTYGLGIKELWEVTDKNHKKGHVQHTVGWPLHSQTYGGSFIYHLANNKVAFGFVVALDYSNASLNPFNLMQQFKTHPNIKPLFTGGRRLCYGARALNEGGYASLPTLSFPGGALIGCAGGLLNVAKIKGIHNAIESGMLAAQAIQSAMPHDLSHYNTLFKQSAAHKELYRARNVRQYFHMGLMKGALLSGLDLKLFRGKMPFTLSHSIKDRQAFNTRAQVIAPTPKLKPDHELTFNRLDSLVLSNLQSEENQPNHLVISDINRFLNTSLSHFNKPETRYCPAQVFEYTQNSQVKAKLIINNSNCLHCKACDIKDPSGTLHWQPPEGGSGPNYTEM